MKNIKTIVTAAALGSVLLCGSVLATPVPCPGSAGGGDVQQLLGMFNNNPFTASFSSSSGVYDVEYSFAPFVHPFKSSDQRTYIVLGQVTGLDSTSKENLVATGTTIFKDSLSSNHINYSSSQYIEKVGTMCNYSLTPAADSKFSCKFKSCSVTVRIPVDS